MVKISIIIPAYNAERTIERTARSVLASTAPVEVWISDDGSKDRTGEIADCLAREDPRVHVLHQSNQGAYRARLQALKHISTPYFGFVDADDTVEPTMFEKMLARAERDGCDVVQCGKTGAESFASEDVGAYVRRVLIEGLGGGAYIWDKIYRNHYDFGAFDLTDNLTNFDDLIFNLYFFEKVRKMGVVDEPLYHYSTTTGSAVHSFSAAKLKDFREVCRVRRALLPRYGVDPDGAENKRWFRMNRMNCIKACIRAGNLSLVEKLRLLWGGLR